MSSVRVSTFVAIAAVALPSPPDVRGGDEPTTAALREKILRADDSDKAAEAYKAYFLRLGRAALRDQMKDEDPGIALQAAWEAHLKPVKRPKPIDRTDDIYDPVELGKFLTVLKDRTKAPVPDWWAKMIVDADLFPGRHHAFPGPFVPHTPDAGVKPPKPAGKVAPPEPKVSEKWGIVGYSVGGRLVAFPTAVFAGRLTDDWIGVVGEKRSAIAAYSLAAGFAFQMAGFTDGGGMPVWKADVWASGRTGLAGAGYHWVEMREREGVVYVFGAESHGAYLEAFDMVTGKCLFRFCSCYWFHWSEEWGLK